MSVVIEIKNLSKWYGNVLGLSDVSLRIEPGITGLLGPNGAGKSTLLKLIIGQLKPSIGAVFLDAQKVRNNPPLYRRIGYSPEHDSFYEEMSGRKFLTSLLKLQGFSPEEVDSRAERALRLVGLFDDRERAVRAYSRGMRQRLKVAQALAHDPEVLILDEPLNGLDPLAKRKVIRLIKDYKKEGRTILISSHVLPEVEAMTREIVLIHQGKVFASGDVHSIRDLIETHPHIISVRCNKPRDLAARLIRESDVVKATFGKTGELLVETKNRDRFFSLLPRLIVSEGLEVEEITSPDDNLQAVFDYLVET